MSRFKYWLVHYRNWESYSKCVLTLKIFWQNLKRYNIAGKMYPDQVRTERSGVLEWSNEDFFWMVFFSLEEVDGILVMISRLFLFYLGSSFLSRLIPLTFKFAKPTLCFIWQQLIIYAITLHKITTRSGCALFDPLSYTLYNRIISTNHIACYMWH